MKKILLTITCVLTIQLIVLAQPKPKPKQPTQSEMDKAMEDAMKGMSEEEKAEMRKMMKEATKTAKVIQSNGITGNIGTGNIIKIPSKKVALLQTIPLLSTATQYNAYLAQLLTSCKKNISPVIIAEVDSHFSKNSSNPNGILNHAVLFLLQQKPQAAVYAAIKTAMLKPEALLVQNNLSVILHQTGYPDKAIPVLQYLAQTYSYPEILNNLGQCYLTLGDTSNARKFFIGCLRKDPNHCEANCAMGLLLTESGKISEATPYIIKSLKNGYTDVADALIKENKIKIKFSDIKPVIPEYFNPQKYKPVVPATSFEMVDPTEAARKELEGLMRIWQTRYSEIYTEQTEKMVKETNTQLADRTRGYISKAPLVKKAQLILLLLSEYYGDFMAANNMTPFDYETKNKAFYEQMEKELKNMYGGGQRYDNEYQKCVKQIEILNNYLLLSTKNHEEYQRKMLPKTYDWINQNLYWNRFLLNNEMYKLQAYTFIKDFFVNLHEYDKMQTLYPTPLWIAKNCKDVKKPEDGKPIVDTLKIEEEDCPFKIEVPITVAKMKWDCKGFEVEGGELIVGGFEKNFRSGEITLFLGLGVGLYEKGFGIGGIEVGAKAGCFIKLGSDGSIIDIGDKGEAGIEGGIGPFMTEAKLTGVMGMQSGINVDGVAFGKDYPDVFNINTIK
ncbi:MAG: hypothetical protein ABIP79_15545 [Chitinophagaceae bacterium]